MRKTLPIFFICIAIVTHAAVSHAISADRPVKNIVLIGWDGAQRAHVKECLERGELPVLKSIAAEGALVEISVPGRTETEPGFARMLTGYRSEVNGVLTNENPGVIPEGFTVFERLEKYFGRNKFITVAVANKGHRFGYASESSPYYNAAKVSDYFKNGLLDDEKVASEAIRLLELYKDEPFFFFVQFASPDAAGHKCGENSKEYNDALIACDKLTGMVVKKLKELGLYGKTAVYITADHGFDEGATGHSNAPYVFMATNDPAVKRNGSQIEIVPTILERFGIDEEKIEPPFEGRPLTR
jgi:predicted AlkP superfamily pyrophosphatase or phosphodiesterase